MEGEFVNKVAQSGLLTIDLEELLGKAQWVAFDLKPFLFMGLVLKEKDFRESLKQHDWESYRDKRVAVFCSEDAVIPMWAYMLVGSYLQPVAAGVWYGNVDDAKQQFVIDAIQQMDVAPYEGQRVVVKGCGDEPMKESAYLAIAVKLRPVVKSLMYGEPCSTVPIYKQKSV